MTTFILAAAAFVLGSFPSGLLIARRFQVDDIRDHGSGNIGASNVAYAAGVRAGVLVGTLDILKGVLPVVLGLWLRLPHINLALVGMAAVFGHDFSIALRFRGGKGVATTFGVILALAPYAAGVALITWVASLLIWKFASLASLLALALLPAYMVVTGQPPIYVILSSALFVLAAAKHHENIANLAHDDRRYMERSLG